VDALRFADIVISSLTKAFSGVGDVLAGSLVLQAGSPLREELRGHLVAVDDDALYADDAVVLEANSRDFEDRMRRVNATTEALCDALRGHPRVAHLYYPKYEIPDIYAQVGKPGGGYGGLFSLLLHDAATTAPGVYDRLRVSKGPSLGNNFTMACPYTLLAHYEELPWAQALGVSPHLIRVSVGLEAPEDLIARFEAALAG
jgi:cystathionine gamma-synthase